MIYIRLITTHCFFGRLLLTEKMFGIFKRKNSNRSSKRSIFCRRFFVRLVCDTLTHATNLIIDGFAKWCFDQPCRVASSQRRVTLFRSMKKFRGGKKQQVHFLPPHLDHMLAIFTWAKKNLCLFSWSNHRRKKQWPKTEVFFYSSNLWINFLFRLWCFE